MAAAVDPETQDALNFWCSEGPLFRRDKLPNQKLDRLLRGIAVCIGSTFEKDDKSNSDLTPSQLAAFYKAVGGDYDPLFRDMPPQSIAFIYKSLGCLHSLQPNPGEDGFSPPSIPALKPQGFVTWQTIQLLLGPEEHVPFMQRALLTFNVVDPVDGRPFPPNLPKEAFPSRPDRHMLAWHEEVSERLRIEAQAHEETDASGRSSTESSVDGATDERADAAQYFSNPFYRNREGRPAIVRHISNAPGHLLAGGQMVVRTMKNFADPTLWTRRRSMPDRSSDDADDNDVVTPKASSSSRHHHHHHHSQQQQSSGRRRSPHRSPRHSPRRGRSPSESSNSDEPRSSAHNIRRHRSHEPAHSPRDYGQQRDRRENNSLHRPQPLDEFRNQDFRPSDSPPFAVKVAKNVPQPGYFDLQGAATPPQSSYARDDGGHVSRPRENQNFNATTYAERTQSLSVPPPSNRNGSQITARQSAPAPVRGVHGRQYPNGVPWR